MHFFTRARRVAGPSFSRRAGVVLPMALAFVLVLGAVAWADELLVDGDELTSGVQTSISFGTVCEGESAARTAVFYIKRTTNGNPNIFKGGSAPVVSVYSAPAWLSVAVDELPAGASSVALPSNWPSLVVDTLSSDTAKATLTVPASAPAGALSGNVVFRATGPNNQASAVTITRDATLSVTATVEDCTPADTTPPVLSGVPTDMTVEGNTTGGANVSWAAPTATDNVDPAPTVGCSPHSGSFFALGGPHTVTCTATDAAGNSAGQSFNVTVVDTTPPVLSGVPSNMVVEGNTTGGANVSWTPPTATDIVDPAPTVGCSPPSSSFFALGGPHNVTCTATDAAGNSAGQSFDISVVDTTAPTLSGVPSNMTVAAASAGQKTVSWTSPTATDIVDPSPTVGCTPASGSSFSIGTTKVTCTATDASGNSSSQSFDVTVVYDFTGFFRPVDNLPTINVAKAGSAIPVKFSLSGDQGLLIYEAGYPKVQTIACDSLAPSDTVEETVTAPSSGLSYDAASDQYNYVWKTNKSWSGCRQLQMKLKDGREYVANFRFTK